MASVTTLSPLLTCKRCSRTWSAALQEAGRCVQTPACINAGCIWVEVCHMWAGSGGACCSLATNMQHMLLLCSQAGWGLTPCTACGVNVLTDTSDSDGLGISPDQCYIPAGWGSIVNSHKQLVAAQCGNGSFGVPDRSYGQEPHPCQVRTLRANRRPSLHLCMPMLFVQTLVSFLAHGLPDTVGLCAAQTEASNAPGAAPNAASQLASCKKLRSAVMLHLRLSSYAAAALWASPGHP